MVVRNLMIFSFLFSFFLKDKLPINYFVIWLTINSWYHSWMFLYKFPQKLVYNPLPQIYPQPPRTVLHRQSSFPLTITSLCTSSKKVPRRKEHSISFLQDEYICIIISILVAPQQVLHLPTILSTSVWSTARLPLLCSRNKMCAQLFESAFHSWMLG